MTKQAFLSRLEKGLSGLPREEAAARAAFYSEIIDDRMEEGLSEEDAVAGVGPVDKIAAQIIEETPFSTLAKQKIRPKRPMSAWEIILLILGSPLWLSLLIALFAVVLAVFAVIWTVVLVFWIVDLVLFCGFLGGAAGGVLLLAGSSGFAGLALFGAGIVLTGLSLLLFFVCRAVTLFAAFLTRKIALLFKMLFF